MRLAKAIAGVIALCLFCCGCLNMASSGKPWERHEGMGAEQPTEVKIETSVPAPAAPEEKAPGTAYREASDI